MATVVSGTWQFGYGDRFDERALKSLPAGSVYSEPGRMNHFARTGAEPVLVEISGFGPTDTLREFCGRAKNVPDASAAKRFDDEGTLDRADGHTAKSHAENVAWARRLRGRD